MDSLTPQERSWNMSRIRGKNTEPELILRSLLHQLGYRFRLNSKLPGKPDLVLPRYHAAVFMHGCFWHRHKGCKFCYTPKSRVDFWNNKFESNIRRDKQVQHLLNEMGWKYLVVWECELKNMERLSKRLKEIITTEVSSTNIALKI